MNRMHRPDEPILVLNRGGFEGGTVSHVHLDGADVLMDESGNEEFVPYHLLFRGEEIVVYDPPDDS